MGSKAQAKASSARAAYMKAKGIARRIGFCPIGHHYVSIPMEAHINTCQGPRRKK